MAVGLGAVSDCARAGDAASNLAFAGATGWRSPAGLLGSLACIASVLKLFKFVLVASDWQTKRATNDPT